MIKELEKPQIDKSPGIEGIHPKRFYETRIEIGEALANLFKKSINLRELPSDWKDAIVVPLVKKRCRSSPGNYRAVSLTSIICKVMEKIKEACQRTLKLKKNSVVHRRATKI